MKTLNREIMKNLVKEIKTQSQNAQTLKIKIKDAQKENFDFNTRYYLRLTVKDKSGVLTKISGAIAKSNISIMEVKQTSFVEEGKAEVIITTHECIESAMRKTIDKLSQMSEVYSVDGVVRIED